MQIRSSTIVLLIIIIVLGAGWVNELRKTKIESSESPSSTQKEVTSPGPSDWFSDYPLHSDNNNFSFSSATASYRGGATITGEVNFNMFFGEICFKVNRESLPNIPKGKEHFCFKNQDDASRMLFNITFEEFYKNNERYAPRTATVRIKDYNLIIMDAGVTDIATLIEVVR